MALRRADEVVRRVRRVERRGARGRGFEDEALLVVRGDEGAEFGDGVVLGVEGGVGELDISIQYV